MALHKEVVLDKGIVAKYFRIAEIDQNFINKEDKFTVYVYGYADESYRFLEKERQDDDMQEIVYFDHIEFSFDDAKGYSRQQIYDRLKTEVPLFEGSIDC